MDKNKILKGIKQVREASKKRNFSQSIDLIINLKDLNLKKPEEQVDLFIQLPKGKGKKVKICALVGPELKEEALRVCDKVIDTVEFANYDNNKKELKKLASEYGFFIAQANIMGQIAKVFGRVLGPRGKMPNPKAGCVAPPKANLQPVYDKLQNTIRLLAKTNMVVQVSIGHEGMTDAEMADNIDVIYETLIHHLPKEENNVRALLLKATMGKPVRLEI
jgi:large subunit ribosomal protein L1